ncbi:hypothetical protein [Rhizobium azibense]|uniref:DUF551 domain-containing protein n=1 Tax=Rhizobium azibense TaxID=1136135 RepID=A0A4R3RER2_9HYPH|nr:hypothetical protein [Rhizobium azibense]TCU34028.1 hypothetical protein EV129_11311 [Rhizobium azibense]
MTDAWKTVDADTPRDGTPILVCNENYTENGFLPLVVRWRTFHPNAKGEACWRDVNGHKVTNVTHWMHLPPHPADPHPVEAPSPYRDLRVRPLEWDDVGLSWSKAETPLGIYTVEPSGIWHFEQIGETLRFGSPDAASARKDAEAHYTDRASSLFDTPSPETNVVGWTKVPEDLPLELLKSINRYNQVLAYENGRYYNAWFEFEQSEGGWVWTDDADSEPNPSHYRILSEVAIATASEVEG